MATIFSESFETDGNGTRYTTNVPEFSDGSGDFFTRTDGGNIGGFYNVSGQDGSFFFAGMDLDGEGAGLPLTLSFTGIDIAGASNLVFSVDLAEDDDGTNEDWDVPDFVRIDYAIDGGAFQALMAFESIPDGDNFNAVPARDTDFDGDGDGPTLTDMFATFGAAIAGTGTSLDLRFTFQLDSGDEDIAIDNLILTGDLTTPPAAPILINEFQPNPTGSDPATQQVELKGPAGQAFSGFLFSLESDAGGSANTVDRKAAVSGSFDANGLLVVTVPDLENPSFTVVLTGDDATANVGDVIDPASPAPLGTILDAIGVTDNATDPVTGAALGGIDIVYTGDEPKLVFRDGATDEAYAINDPDGGDIYGADGSVYAPTAFDVDPLAGDTFGTANPVRGATPPPPPPPTATNRLISEIQGTGDASPLEGDLVTVTGIVTGSFQGTLDGFFLQEEDADSDGNAATSEGIFVFAPGAPAVEEGYTVTVTGTVAEFFDETQIAADSVGIDSLDTAAGLAAVTPTIVDLPVPAGTDRDDFYEPFEGMLVEFADTLTVTQLFNYERFGEIHLAEGGRVYQYTQTNAPDVAGNAAYQEEQLARRIVLDDGSDEQNPDTLPFLNVPEFGAGDTVDGLTGVVRYSFGDYRINPTEANPITVVNANPREATPADTGGSLKVASFNVLNYFLTLDEPGNEGTVNGNDPRGAHSIAELNAQAAKIVAALDAIDADVVGLVEVENDDDSAMHDLVTRLNAVSDRTYDVVPTGVIGGDAIKVGFIYDTETVRIAPGTTVAVLDTDAFVAPVSTVLDPNDVLPTDPKNRPAVAVTFEEIATGETFTAVNNHLKSKGSGVEGEDFNLLSGPDLGTIDGVQPVTGVDDGQGNGSATRESAADQLVDWLATNPTGTTDADILILGDLNAYAAETAIGQITEGADDTTGTDDDYTDLAQSFIGPDAYSFRFSGQWGTLDYALANNALLGQVSGVTEWHANSDEPAYRDYNDRIQDANERSFEAKPNALADAVDTTSPFRSSDHDPVIVGLNLSTEPQVYTLELLHLTDQELSSADLGDIPRASAILNALEAQDLGNDGIADNTLRLSSGDLSIPGPFFSASEAVFGSVGIADIQIANEMGFDAVALGNHEFDGGTEELAALIDGSAPGDFAALSGTALDGQDFTGADFPFLATNLNFSSDGNLAPLTVAGGGAPQPNVVTSSVVQNLGGEQIGIIGAITPTVGSISSPGGVGIAPTWAGSNPTPAEIDALAAEIQLEVDALLTANTGLNKIVLLSHMQQIGIEFDLAEKLSGVDIIVAGGSNTRLFDADDRVRPGDTDQGQYPQFFKDADNNDVAVVNTDGSVKYVGRLVIDFDENGNIIPGSYDETVSGAYATDAQGVADLNAEALIDPEVQAITDAIEAQIIASESNVFGISDVFLNGNRAGGPLDGVRTQETNLGNLTADANLAAARGEDPTIMFSLKNGGGIRDSIGEIVVPAGQTEAVRQANPALFDSDGNLIKPEGGISQNDIDKVLAFNNDLVALTLTKSEIVDLLEHGLSGLPGVSGRFLQIAGLELSFDPDAPAGERVLSAALVDDAGDMLVPLVFDGDIVGNPDATYRIVTLDFLARPRFDEDTGAFTGGGDGYPFPNFNTDPNAVLDEDGNGIAETVSPEVAARIDFVNLTQEDVRTGDATFADDLSEQDALAEYIDDNFNPAKGGTAYNDADTGRDLDQRIQNIDFRSDDVFDFDNLVIGDGSSPLQSFALTDGVDLLFFEDDLANGARQRIVIDGFEAGVDRVSFEAEDVLFSREAGPNLLVFIDNDDRDSFVFRGVDSVEDLFTDVPLV